MLYIYILHVIYIYYMLYIYILHPFISCLLDLLFQNPVGKLCAQSHNEMKCKLMSEKAWLDIIHKAKIESVVIRMREKHGRTTGASPIQARPPP